MNMLIFIGTVLDPRDKLEYMELILKVCAFKIVLLCLFSFFLNFASSFQSLTHFIFLCLT